MGGAHEEENAGEEESHGSADATLRVVGLFVILVAGLAGIAGAIYGPKRSLVSSPWYLVLRSFAAGIMLGVAFIHILADASSSLAEVSENYPALAMTVATIGVLLVMLVEQLVIFLLTVTGSSSVKVLKGSAPGAAGHKQLSAQPPHQQLQQQQQQQHHVRECELSKPAVAAAGSADCSCEPLASAGDREEQGMARNISGVVAFGHENDMGHDHGHGHEHGHSEICCNDHDARDHAHSHAHAHAHARWYLTEEAGGALGVGDLSLLVKALIMEVAIALHSIIIGVAFGSMGSAAESEVIGLLVALAFHQMFEGIALGTALQAVRAQLGSRKVLALALTFALTTPAGILIGLLATNGEDPSEAQVYAEGVLKSIAAGNLVYIALVEMISEDFNSPLATKMNLRGAMLGALCAGDFVMAIIAIWA